MTKMIAVTAFALVLANLTSVAVAGARGGVEALNQDYYTHNKYYRRDNRPHDGAAAIPSNERQPPRQDGGAISATTDPSMITTSDRLTKPLQDIRR
jgi:hypothetical protein